MKKLVFRVDAGNDIGTGHLMRCLALAQKWQDTGGKAVFITTCRNENLLRRLRVEGFSVRLLPGANPGTENDWNKTREVIADYDTGWLVLDGYHFNEVYQQNIKDAGYKLLAIDDMAQLEHYYADVILNQNLHAGQSCYCCQPDTRLLLGSEYVLLRREFLAYENKKRETVETAKKILVTMGGADARNYTSETIRALQKMDIPQLEAVVVIGANNPHKDTVEAIAKESPVPVNIIRNADNMPQFMAQTDIAVCSAGATVWELAFMGVPSVIAATTPVEEYLIEGLREYGLFTSLNWVNGFSESELINTLSKLITDKEARRNMSELGRNLVDGWGCNRVIRAIIDSGQNNE